MDEFVSKSDVITILYELKDIPHLNAGYEFVAKTHRLAYGMKATYIFWEIDYPSLLKSRKLLLMWS